MTPLIPPALTPGDTIGIMAPSSRVSRPAVEKSKALLESHGYHVYIHPQTFAEDRASAGTAEEKSAAFHDLWRGPAIKAIMAVRGGNRAGTMLEYIDFDIIEGHPKPLIGFSDVTMLLNAISGKTGLVTFHGPVLTWLIKGQKKDGLEQIFTLLNGEDAALPMDEAQILKEGTAQGPLYGGNLSIFTSLIGTPYMPDCRGALLFLEDLADEWSRYDRMFIQLRNAGILGQIGGLIIGDLSGEDTGGTPFGFTLTDILNEHTRGYDIPIITNAPFGHRGPLYTLPVGAPAELRAEKGKISLEFLGPAVQK